MASAPTALGASVAPAAAQPFVQSARWAAWGDARGFPAELGRESRERQQRLREARPAETFSWSRRVGGRLGPTVSLPAGTYSDDTQLRLSTCRCIRSNGQFDVEAFSKIELPVFLSYGLGVGRGTRAAAQHLARRGVRWNSNFFEARGSRYVDGGGNGAAMRIQPHVWAAGDGDDERILAGVARDAVTTHGHARGILGAAFHALCLSDALHGGSLPAPDAWSELVARITSLPDVMSQDDALSERWLPLWKRASGQPWEHAVAEAAQELREMLTIAEHATSANGPVAERYEQLCDVLGGLEPKTRGGGHICAVLAAWLAWEGRDQPIPALLAAADLRGSDTDTVASMAGALIGAVASDRPPGELLDDGLHASEALRLWRIGRCQPVEDFPHPDPLHWEPPATQSDAVGSTNGDLVVAGLGRATALSEVQPAQGTDDVGWQWLSLAYGQSILVKRRLRTPALPETQIPPDVAHVRPARSMPPRVDDRGKEIAPSGPPARGRANDLPQHIDQAVEMVVARSFDVVLIGRLTMHFARMEQGAEKAAVFAGLVADRLRNTERARVRTPSA